MKKIYYHLFSLLAIVALASCDGNLDSEGLTSVDDYPKIVLNGEKFTISPIGETYTDAGASATFVGQDYTSKMTTTGLDKIDINTAGIYYVKYSATGPNGYSWSEKRTVAVCDPTITTDLGGTWKVQPASSRTDNGETFTNCTVKIVYLCPGVFTIDDYMAGFYQQHRYGSPGSPNTVYNLMSSGILQLTSDNKLVKISSSGVPSFGDTAGCTNFDGSYNPDTETITYDAKVLGYTFHVVLNK